MSGRGRLGKCPTSVCMSVCSAVTGSYWPSLVDTADDDADDADSAADDVEDDTVHWQENRRWALTTVTPTRRDVERQSSTRLTTLELPLCLDEPTWRTRQQWIFVNDGGHRPPTCTRCSQNQLTGSACVYVITSHWNTPTSCGMWGSFRVSLLSNSLFSVRCVSLAWGRDGVLQCLTDRCAMPMTLVIRHSVAVGINCRQLYSQKRCIHSSFTKQHLSLLSILIECH